MNKYVSLFCCIALLFGCDKPEQSEKTESVPIVLTEQQSTTSPVVLAGYESTLLSGGASSVKSSDLIVRAKSEEELANSLDSIIAKLSESEKEAFAEAFFVYATSKIDVSLDDMTNRQNMLVALDNRSVKDIIHMAEQLKTERNTDLEQTALMQ